MAPFATEAEEKKYIVQKKEALIADRKRKLRKEALDAKHVAVQLQLTAGQHDRIVNGS